LHDWVGEVNPSEKFWTVQKKDRTQRLNLIGFQGAKRSSTRSCSDKSRKKDYLGSSPRRGEEEIAPLIKDVTLQRKNGGQYEKKFCQGKARVRKREYGNESSFKDALKSASEGHFYEGGLRNQRKGAQGNSEKFPGGQTGSRRSSSKREGGGKMGTFPTEFPFLLLGKGTILERCRTR